MKSNDLNIVKWMIGVIYVILAASILTTLLL